MSSSLAHKLDDQRSSQHLYVLDEPTVSLHMADVEKLLRVLHRQCIYTGVD